MSRPGPTLNEHLCVILGLVIDGYEKALRVGNAFLLVDGTDETVVRVAEIAVFPNRSQSRQLDRLLDLVREAYNAALQERRDAWRLRGHTVQLFDQFAQITELRELRPEIKTFGIQPIRGALRRVDHAFSAFFRRCSAGDKPGYPRFKSRSRYRSIDYDEPASWRLSGLASERPRIYVQGIGDVRLGRKGVRQLRRLSERGGEPRTLRLVKGPSGHGWHAFVSFRNVAVQEISAPSEQIGGIDRGIANTIALPDGTLVSMPRFLDEARAEIAELQHRRALVKPGSSQCRLLSRRIAKAHRKAKNQSINWARHLAAELVERYGVIVLEKLELANMTRSAKGTIERPGHNVAQKSGLSRSLQEAALSRLAYCICVKAEGAGRRVWAVPAKDSSRQCAACGHTEKANRPSQAEFFCLSCGHRQHADVNAAQVITARGAAAETAWLAKGCPVRSRPQPRLRRRRTDNSGEGVTGAGSAPHAELVA